MTSTIPEAEILRELEKDTRDAWEHYQGRLRELTGAEYERVEAESWDELQSELERLDRRREDLQADGRLTERQRSDAPGHRGPVRIRAAVIVAAGAVALAGCGSSGGTAVSRVGPPNPLSVSVLITNSRVVASPSRFGAGPVLFTVTNQASDSRTLQIFRGRDMRVADTAPLNPQGSTEVSADLQPGPIPAERRLTRAHRRPAGRSANRAADDPRRPHPSQLGLDPVDAVGALPRRAD